MRLYFFIFMLVFGLNANGQNPGARTERINAAKAAYITERLGLTAEEAEKFWPIYNEFSAKKNQIRKELVNAKREGLEEKEIVDLGFKLKQDELDLEKDYSQRMLQVISAEKLVKLKVAEKEFRDIVIRQIQQRQLQQERKESIRERQQQRLQQRNN